MKRYRVFGIVLLLASMVLGCNYGIMEEYYSDYDEAVADGAIERGWIPEFLPESSFDIYEKHDIDNNKIWLTYKFARADLENLCKNFVLADTTHASAIDKFFESQFDADSENIKCYNYLENEKERWIAVDTVNLVCYFYRPR